MKRFLLILALAAGLESIATAQCILGTNCLSLPNDTTTGTLTNHLAKVTGAPSAALVTTAGDTFGAIGVSVNGGTSGVARIQYQGSAVCAFDGGTTAGHFVGISAAVAGDCTDAGATCPAGENIGYIFQTHTGAGTYPVLLSINTCTGSGGGAVTGTGTTGFGAVWAGASSLGNGPADILQLNPTTDATHGVITFNGIPVLHGFPSGNDNTYLGGDSVPAGNFTNTGDNNVGIGEATLSLVTSGFQNTMVGVNAGFNVTTGETNTGIGLFAEGNITTGSQNTAIGESACTNVTTQAQNTCLGWHSNVADATITNGTAIGNNALATISNSVMIGNSVVELLQSPAAADFAGSRKTLTNDWTCGTGGTVTDCSTAQIIGTNSIGPTLLTFTLPLLAEAWHMHCHGVVGQATAATANSWNFLTATNGATNVTASYHMNTAATAMTGGATTDQASTTTTVVIGPTWTLGGTATKMPFDIDIDVEGAAAAGTVLSLQLVAPTVADLVTIYRGATCTIGF